MKEVLTMTLVRCKPRKRQSLVPALFDFERDPFQRFFSDIDAWLPANRPEPDAWLPAIDIFERNGDLVVKAELPGVEPKDLNITVTDNVLRLEGERSEETETEEKGFYRHERFHGTFERSVPLPTEVAADKVEATYKKGILEIVMPKTETVKTHTVKIKAGK